MRKITLIMALVACAMFTNATNIVGTFNGSIPTGWTYITNNPTYPDPSFYTTAGLEGLKMNFENQGVCSPAFNAENAVTVILNVNALNQNTKTGTSTDAFTVYGLNSDSVPMDTKTIGNTALKVGDNTVYLTGTGISIVKIIMTGYPNDGTKYCNVNLKSVTITSASGVNSTKANNMSMFVANRTLMVEGIADGTMIEIYSATGARIMMQELVNGQVQLDNLSKGVYVVRAGNEKCKIVL